MYIPFNVLLHLYKNKLNKNITVNNCTDILYIIQHNSENQDRI